jgi:hypothetical protein
VLGAEIHWVAVVVSAVVTLIIGSAWYAPFLFGNMWLHLVGKTKEQAQADFHPMMIVGTFLLAMVMAVLLSAFISWLGAAGWIRGAYVGFYAGIGFTATTFAINDLFEKRPILLWLINATHHVFVLTVMGAILGAWR